MRDFPEHVQHLHSNDDFLFTEEYSSVEPDHAPSSEVCMRPENQSKNRYANIRAYDHSRIKLTELPNEIGSDYINANRLDVSSDRYLKSLLNWDHSAVYTLSKNFVQVILNSLCRAIGSRMHS